MRNSKFSPILIIVLCMVIVAIILFAVTLFKNDDNPDKSNEEEVEVIMPVIELSLNTSEENQESVIISVSATTEDELGIDYLVLPDGSFIYADNKEYEVTENGSYEFSAVGLNGAEDTLSIEVSNIREISANNPYIPEGFEHIGGEVDAGYIIQDAYGNQYVWVPISTGILTRTTMLNSEYEESNTLATSLVNSVAKNYGFYIARFEASQYEKDGQKVAASMPGQIPWTNVAYQEAYDVSLATAGILGYTDLTTALINSYAWDSTLEWLNQAVTNYSTNTSYGNYSGTVYPTGATESDQINNICDMAGNVREWTTEIYETSTTTSTKSSKNTELNVMNRVIRGGSASINKIANSRNGYAEDLIDGYWGFRTVLFKSN